MIIILNILLNITNNQLNPIPKKNNRILWSLSFGNEEQIQVLWLKIHKEINNTSPEYNQLTKVNEIEDWISFLKSLPKDYIICVLSWSFELPAG